MTLPKATEEAQWQALSAGSLWVHDAGATVFDLVGPDARRFANSMFTNRFVELAVGSGVSSAFCDAKGRMLGLLHAWQMTEEVLRLVLEGVDPSAFAARYGKYIVLDDVELELRDALEVWALLGPEADATLQAAGLVAPAPGQCLNTELGLLAGTAERGRRGVEWIGTAEQRAALEGRLGEVVRGTPAALEWLRIAAAAPRWPVDMSDKEMVATLGLREERLHFEKGCYIGQETIHRLDVMGKLRKRLCVVQLPVAIPPGSTAQHDGKKAGTLTSVVRHPEHGWLAVGILRDPGSELGARLAIDTGEASVAGVVWAAPSASAGMA